MVYNVPEYIRVFRSGKTQPPPQRFNFVGGDDPRFSGNCCPQINFYDGRPSFWLLFSFVFADLW